LLEGEGLAGADDDMPASAVGASPTGTAKPIV